MVRVHEGRCDDGPSPADLLAHNRKERKELSSLSLSSVSLGVTGCICHVANTTNYSIDRHRMPTEE